MTENEIGTIIVDTAIALHRDLGPGLLETVYEVVLAHELQSRGFALMDLIYSSLVSRFPAPLSRNLVMRLWHGSAAVENRERFLSNTVPGALFTKCASPEPPQHYGSCHRPWLCPNGL